jgi:hypothetical protein
MKKKGKAPTHGTSENEGKAWGHGQFANMPQEAIMKPYPAPDYTTDGHIDDTIMRLDDDEKDAVRKKRKNMDKGMY